MEELLYLKKKAVELISNYFGPYMAGLYDKFYADKSEEVILVSVEELLEEHLGKKKAAEQIEKLKNKINHPYEV